MDEFCIPKMSKKRREIYNETLIKIRILKALADTKPYGILKHFHMIKISRNLKRPNVISTEDIWKFMRSKYDLERLDRESDDEFNSIRFESMDVGE